MKSIKGKCHGKASQKNRYPREAIHIQKFALGLLILLWYVLNLLAVFFGKV